MTPEQRNTSDDRWAVLDPDGDAAALLLGAQGANVGTRFLASEEASVAESEDTVRFGVWKEIMPPASGAAYATVPRVIRTPFVEAWGDRPDEAKRHAEQLRGEIMGALREGRSHELLPFTGQTAGLVHDVLPAGEIVRRIIAEAEQVLSSAASLMV